MTPKRQFVAAYLALAELVGKTPSPAAIDAFWGAIAPYPIEAILRAMRQHQRLSPYLVQPADIVRLIDGTPQGNAIIAWGKVLEAIEREGPYHSVVFEDERITASLVAIYGEWGWERICAMSEREEPFVQKRFVEAYEQFAVHGCPTGYTRKLVGIHERKNRGRYELDEHTAPTAYIGDKAACLRLLEKNNDKSGEVIAKLRAVK